MQNKKVAIALSVSTSLLIVGVSVLGGWLFTDAGLTLFPHRKTDTQENPPTQDTSFILPAGPQLENQTIKNAPTYLYLFTHSEDPFNHELSENRFWRVGDMIETVATLYPNIDLTWTIEFQGSEAQALSNRNAQTGLVDYLKTLSDRGLVEFGYHGQHDPTYTNRPQNDLPKQPSYEDVYAALWSWITCEKDPLQGGCVRSRGGGIEAVKNLFGEVNIVTGIGIGNELQAERSAGSMAVRTLLPERLLGFGFPDHGSVSKGEDYSRARNALLSALTPTNQTSSTVFWMDNTLRINDGVPAQDILGLKASDGTITAQKTLEALDRTHPNLLNVAIADKYLYTVSSTSPTKWAYSNPDSPELPPKLLRSEQEMTKRYELTKQTLEYLVKIASDSASDTRFVSSDQAIDLFVSDDYWQVDADELEQMALWILNNWNGQPPDWAYDGEDFYSLSDAFALLISGMQEEFPNRGIVSNIYGPWSQTISSTRAQSVQTQDLTELLDTTLMKDDQISETYRVGSQTFTASQLLYAFSYLYVLDRHNATWQSIEIPETKSAPKTYAQLEALGCTDCFDTSWSLKPAKFQE